MFGLVLTWIVSFADAHGNSHGGKKSFLLPKHSLIEGKAPEVTISSTTSLPTTEVSTTSVKPAESTTTQQADPSHEGSSSPSFLNPDTTTTVVTTSASSVVSTDKPKQPLCDQNGKCVLKDIGANARKACCTKGKCSYEIGPRDGGSCTHCTLDQMRNCSNTTISNQGSCTASNQTWTSTILCPTQDSSKAVSEPCGCHNSTDTSNVDVDFCYDTQACSEKGKCECPLGRVLVMHVTGGVSRPWCVHPKTVARARCCNNITAAKTTDGDKEEMDFDTAASKCLKNNMDLCGKKEKMGEDGVWWAKIDDCEQGEDAVVTGTFCTCKSKTTATACPQGSLCTTGGTCMSECDRNSDTVITEKRCVCSAGAGVGPERCDIGQVCKDYGCDTPGGLRYRRHTGYCLETLAGYTKSGNAIETGGEKTEMTTVAGCLEQCNERKESADADAKCYGFISGGGQFSVNETNRRCQIITNPIDSATVRGPYQCRHTDLFVAVGTPITTTTTPSPQKASIGMKEEAATAVAPGASVAPGTPVAPGATVPLETEPTTPQAKPVSTTASTSSEEEPTAKVPDANSPVVHVAPGATVPLEIEPTTPQAKPVSTTESPAKNEQKPTAKVPDANSPEGDNIQIPEPGQVFHAGTPTSSPAPDTTTALPTSSNFVDTLMGLFR